MRPEELVLPIDGVQKMGQNDICNAGFLATTVARNRTIFLDTLREKYAASTRTAQVRENQPECMLYGLWNILKRETR
jgi:hypothetical protein